MFQKWRQWRQKRRVRHYYAAVDAFARGDIREVYYELGKLTGSTSSRVEESFRVAAVFQNKTTYQLLRDALEPQLHS